MSSPVFHHIFIGRALVVMPTVARTTTGLFLDVEPVVAIALSDHEAIITALTALIALGNPEVPLPPRDGYQPVVCRYGGAKNWSAFTKKFNCISFTREGDEFRIDFTARDLRGRLIDNPSRTCRVPVAAIVNHLLGHILRSNES